MSVTKILRKKPWLLCLAICSLLLILFFFICFFTKDSRHFARLTANLFTEELSGDALSLHYTIAYPEKYNLEGTVSLPAYFENWNPKDEQTQLRLTLDELSQISRKRLSSQDAYTYDLLTRYLSKRLDGAAFAYYAEPLAPSSGMQSGLPILLADYTFRRAEDVETYLALLDQTDTYFDGLISYEKEKARQGLFMPSYSSAKIIEQCDSIMDKRALANGTHFLHTTFSERLNELQKQGLISSEDVEKWMAENDRLLTTVMQPAYERTADAFTLLENAGTNPRGLFYFPEGKSYYEYLLSYTTCSDRSVVEIKKLLFEDYQKNFEAMLTVLEKYPEITSFSSDTVSADFPDSPSAMLEDLQACMEEDFPAFPQNEEAFTPACIIKRVSPSMENYCSPAYYLTPPIDDMNHNIIYINHKSAPDALTLYTTLAHEGYPGHLYQTVYSQLYRNLHQENPIRNLLHYGGYVEGWALYVEDLSYRYAGEQVKASSPEAAAYYECCRISRNLHLCLYSLLDIAIHYEGATFSQVHKILQSIGVNDLNTSKSIYEYIVEEPTNYPKYYLGFLELKLLKEKARALWADDFSNYRFHKFILETGPCDFIGLESQLSSSSISSRYPLSHKSIFSFLAASTAGAVKY